MGVKACNQARRKENKGSSIENFERLQFVGVSAEVWGKGLPQHIC